MRAVLIAIGEDQRPAHRGMQNRTFAMLAAAHSYAGSPDQAHTETWVESARWSAILVCSLSR